MLLLILYKYMTSRTTVAIDKELRKRLKKISAWLDITQAEVIKRSLSLFEREIFKNKNDRSSKEKKVISTTKITLKNATEMIWKEDPKRKAIQQKLSSGSETIDDFILDNWDTGLKE